MPAKKSKKRSKYLVASKEKAPRGCYDLYGWCYENKRGPFVITLNNGRGIEVKTITEKMYLDDFTDWDLEVSTQQVKDIFKDKTCQIQP